MGNKPGSMVNFCQSSTHKHSSAGVMTPVCHFHLAGPEPGLSLLCENGFLDETVFEEKKKCILDIRSLEKSISRKRQQHLLQQLYRVSL
jgi:hypothetical protein